MYTVKCDGFPLLDIRDEELILVNPKVKLEINTVGEGSFKIYKNHPYYTKLQKLKSLFEISDQYGVLFRGRMTDSTRDFENGMAVDLEGALAFFNDSMVRPFSFPKDFLQNAEYNASSNKVEFFLKWLIDNHNSQVQDFQKFKLGTVTVADSNNYINRSSSDYLSTWEAMKDKLFNSSLGGYLCIRYEDDGNYIDYLSDFTETNAQSIEFGENLLNLVRKTDATATYSAMIPIGATLEGEPDKDGNIPTTLVTIEGLADSNTADDIVKKGDTLYSKAAVAAFGWIYAPVEETTWEDVTEPSNLLKKAKEWLVNQGVMLAETVEVSAADLHFTNELISSFRIYKKINVNSLQHGISSVYNLKSLNIELLNPQNTKITVGATRSKSYSDIQREKEIEYDAAINNVQETVISLKNTISNISHLMADAITTKNLAAEVAELGYLSAKSAELLYASIDDLQAITAEVEELTAKAITTESIAAEVAKLGYLTAERADLLYASIKDLNATNAKIDGLVAKAITTDNLTAKVADLGYLKADTATLTYATISDLNAVNANVSNLDADVADINTLIFGSATGSTIQTSFANAVIAQLGNAQIKSAMIDNITASKITSGDIVTNNVNVKSQSGSLVISDETMQISDDKRVRVQIGKDASNDYSINIWDANGNLMFSKGGITDSAIKSAIIRNDMVSDTANFQG